MGAPAVPLQTVLGDARNQQASQAAAAVFGARKANDASEVKGPAQAVVEGELSVAAANLPEPAAKDVAEANARVEVGLRGDLKKANEEWAKARGEASKLSSQIADLAKQLSAQQEKAAREQAEQKARFEKEIKDLKDGNVKTLQTWLSRILIGAGVAGLAACAFVIFSSGLAALPKAGLGGIGSLLFIGAGLIVGQPWFLWVAGGALLLGVAASVWYGIHLHQTSKIAQSLARRDQDILDAAAEGNEKARLAAEELKAHTAYRVDPATAKTIAKRLVKEGVNTDHE